MKKVILAIESSCDETAAAIIRGDLGSKHPNITVLSSVVHSQVDLHKGMGGVVPEVAARAHVKHISPVTTTALKQASIPLSGIDFIAVTAGPGLIASLLVGVEFAKGLSVASGIPILSINHMEGHLYSPLGNHTRPAFPILSLIVSGGHTLLVLQKDEKNYKVLGSTVDDAAGEAFDKVAKLLGLPYPGGPQISKLAENGKNTIPFPRPMIHSKDFNFSFAGLKTAVRYFMENKENKKIPKADIATSFENAVVDVLVRKTLAAAIKYKCKTISLSGGVAANKKLRTTLSEECAKHNLNFIVPELNLCTDNAEMIALAAYFKLRTGSKPKPAEKIQADSTWEIK